VIELTITKAALLRAVTVASYTVAKDAKAAETVKSILVEASDAGVRFTGTDFVQSCSIEVEAKVAEAGRACIPAAPLLRFAAGLPSDAEASIKVGPAGATIRSGRMSVKLPVIFAEDFPEIDVPVGEVAEMTIAGSELRRLLASSAEAASTDMGTRQYLCGVFVEVSGSAITTTATDGARVHTAPGKLLRGPSSPISAIISNETVDQVQKLIESAGEVEIALTDRLIRVNTGEAIYASRLVEGTYPDWRRIVIPAEDCDFIASINRAELSTTVKRCMDIVGITRHVVIFQRADGIVVACHDGVPGGRSASEVVLAEIAGSLQLLVLNAAFLRDALDAITSETVTFGFSASGMKSRLWGDDPNQYAIIAPYATKPIDRVIASEMGARPDLAEAA